MGSGPATHLSSLYKAYSLLLMSPYTSIKDVSKSLFGKMSFLITPLVYERFRNIDAIKGSQCPVFFLHGLKDKLIPHSHTLELNNHCPSISFLQLPPEMDHNQFDFDEDLIKPFKAFLKKIDDAIASEKRRNLKGVASEKITNIRQVTKIDGSHVIFKETISKEEKEKRKVEAVSTNDNGDDGSNDSNNASSSNEDSDEEDALALVASGDKFEIKFEDKLYEPPAIVK